MCKQTKDKQKMKTRLEELDKLIADKFQIIKYEIAVLNISSGTNIASSLEEPDKVELLKDIEQYGKLCAEREHFKNQN